MDVFKLSRDWFDFCFDNPEKIKPNHAALYFFCIEHCNRLGWKEKFGLPMEMAKDAIGIKNYRTYSKTFEDLIEWGFIKVIQKSKNQYSSNIIAIAEYTKASTKALDKAMQKHSQKHSQKQYKSIVGIDIQETYKQETLLLSTWRENFDVYLSELNEAYDKLINDDEFIKEQQEFYPEVDIRLSIKKAVTNFWGCKGGWKNKKDSKTKVIDWKETLKNAISKNRVFVKSNGYKKDVFLERPPRPSVEHEWDNKIGDWKKLPVITLEDETVLHDQ